MNIAKSLTPAALATLLWLIPGAAAAQRDQVLIELRGFEEVPAVSSSAFGTFSAVIDSQTNTIDYELIYSGLTGEVRQGHIHFGQRSVNGGISVFLCQTTQNPDPTNRAPTCNPSPARIVGTLTSANIVGPSGQGIAANEMGELITAIRAQIAYVNVHTTTYPGGEIRGQFDGRRVGRGGRPDLDE